MSGLQAGDTPLVDSFTYTVADGHGGTDSATLRLLVLDDAPAAQDDDGGVVAGGALDIATALGGTLTFAFADGGTDVDAGGFETIALLANIDFSTDSPTVQNQGDGQFTIA